VEQGQHEAALEVLRHAAQLNGQDPHRLFPESTELIIGEEEEDDADYCAGGAVVDPGVSFEHEKCFDHIDEPVDSSSSANHHNHHHPHVQVYQSLFHGQWTGTILCFFGVWLFLDLIYWGTIQVVTLA